MNIERYLGAYYPIFHRTSVSRRILLALLAVLLIPTMVMHTISSIVFAISNQWHLLIIMALFLPPFIFVNIKLLIIVGKVRPERAVSDEKRKRKNLENISTALLPALCYCAFQPVSTLHSCLLTNLQTP